MFNSTKIRTAIAALAISVTAFAGVASAQAGGKADTKVSIKGDNGDYYGYVKSSDNDCELNRTVKVFKMLGDSPSPKTDLKIGTDVAQPNGPDSMWSIGNSGYKSGDFYAKVGKTSLCKGATSKVISR
jgi:hypothetical protein